MRIEKKYKIEEACSKDKIREVLKSVYVYQNGQNWAVATDGRILARVPVVIEDGELSKGNSIKAHDLKFNRSNPAVKKNDDFFVFLQPLDGQFPDIEAAFPKKEATVSIKLDVGLLSLLSKALGSDIVQLDIVDNRTAVKVLANNSEANGLIMPVAN